MIKALKILSLVVLANGCTTTKLLDHWQSESFSRDQLNNVLIVAITIAPENRFLFETEIERLLLEGGRRAVTSQRALGDGFPEKEAVDAYIEKHDIDYVMVSGLSDVNVEREQIPTQIRTYYTGPYYPSYGHYYGGNTVTLVRPGYVDRTTTLVLVTTIFDARTEQPVWVGHSKSVEPGSANYLAADVARSAWDNMAR
jgi:hypothetical protein